MAHKIILAEDHQIVRQGLKTLLEQAGFDVAGEAQDGREAVQLAKVLRPDVAVLDLAMPKLNGLLAARKLLKVSPQTKSVLLTMHQEAHYVVAALQAEVKGYVLKSQAAEDLVRAIHEVMAGAIYLSPGISHVLVDAYLGKSDVPPDPLTPREREVLQLIAEGQKMSGIAALLGISIKTAESHRSNIMEKLDIHNVAGLVRYAIRRDLVKP